jgi:hypothetical protein
MVNLRLLVTLILLSFSLTVWPVQLSTAYAADPPQSSLDPCADKPTAAERTECQKAARDAATTAKECDGKKKEGYVYIGVLQKCYTLPDFITTAINYVLMFSSIIAGFIFVMGAYNYLISRGDPGKLGEGREMITNAVVGMVLIASAFAIIRFLNGAFQTVDSGINLLPFIR